MVDIKIKVVHCELYFKVQRYLDMTICNKGLYDRTLDIKHLSLQKYDPKFDLRIYIGQSDLYFIAQKLYPLFFSRFCF